MKKILLILMCLFINTKVYAYYSSDPAYNGGYTMPDLYNTGPTSAKSELVDFSVKYPNIGCDDTYCRISYKNIDQNGAVFEGFKTNKTILINGVSNITIKNFYIETDNVYGIHIVDWNNKGVPNNIVIENGEIKGTTSAGINGANVKIRKVYIHEYGGDAIKIASNQLIESNYIGSGGLKEGAHADGVQLTGAANNVKIYGNRFDMIGSFDNYKANATLFLQLEKGTANNIDVAYNWLNGGGYTIYVNEYTEGTFTGINFKDNKIGNGRRFGYMTSNFTSAAKNNIKGMDTFIYAEDVNVPFIGSVIYYNQNGKIITDLKDANQKIKIAINTANYTSNAQNIILEAKLYNNKNELVKTYKQENTIKRNMPGNEYITNKNVVLLKVSMSDFPQNILTTLDINDLPSNTNGYYIKVSVYKKDTLNKTLRTSTITNSNKAIVQNNQTTTNNKNETNNSNQTVTENNKNETNDSNQTVTENNKTETNDSNQTVTENNKIETNNSNQIVTENNKNETNNSNQEIIKNNDENTSWLKSNSKPLIILGIVVLIFILSCKR